MCFDCDLSLSISVDSQFYRLNISCVNKIMIRGHLTTNNQGDKTLTSAYKRPHADQSIGKKKLKITDKENFLIDQSDDDTDSMFIHLNRMSTCHPTSKQYIISDTSCITLISRTARHWCLKYRRIFEHMDPTAYNVCVDDTRPFTFIVDG
jgi:hypothetical protein